jgi:hypothetical protein
MSETPWVPGSTDEASSDAGTDFKPITTQEEFEQRIKGRLNKQASKFSDYEDVKAVAQDAQQRITQLQHELESERFNTVRTTVASTKGVPAHRISGNTQEELEASAEAYLAEVADLTKATRQPRKTGLSSGATGTDNRLDPKEKAAAMLQQMFNNGG